VQEYETNLCEREGKERILSTSSHSAYTFTQYRLVLQSTCRVAIIKRLGYEKEFKYLDNSAVFGVIFCIIYVFRDSVLSIARDVFQFKINAKATVR
jgi:hypothetical protein